MQTTLSFLLCLSVWRILASIVFSGERHFTVYLVGVRRFSWAGKKRWILFFLSISLTYGTLVKFPLSVDRYNAFTLESTKYKNKSKIVQQRIELLEITRHTTRRCCCNLRAAVIIRVLRSKRGNEKRKRVKTNKCLLSAVVYGGWFMSHWCWRLDAYSRAQSNKCCSILRHLLFLLLLLLLLLIWLPLWQRRC